jgi:hypothetical protein
VTLPTASQSAGQALQELCATFEAVRDYIRDRYSRGVIERPQMIREMRAALARYHDGAQQYNDVLWDREMSRG